MHRERGLDRRSLRLRPQVGNGPVGDHAGAHNDEERQVDRSQRHGVARRQGGLPAQGSHLGLGRPISRRKQARRQAEQRLGAARHERRRREHEQRHMPLRRQREVEECEREQPLAGAGPHASRRQAGEQQEDDPLYKQPSH